MFAITREAMEVLTPEQRDALLHIAGARVAGVTVQKGGFDLPDGYLAFGQRYEEGVIIYGGIAPDGAVST